MHTRTRLEVFMRRFWAYIISIFTAILVVGVGFVRVFNNMESNLEYQYGRELVFRVSDKDGNDLPEDGSAVNNIADQMEKRLSKADITAYSVKTVGNDTLKVQVNQDTSAHYEMISNYLTFNATLALTTDKDDIALMNEFRSDKPAYVKADSKNLPQIFIPVDTSNAQFQSVIEAAKNELEEAEKEGGDEEKEDEETKTVYIYLWYDFVEDIDSYEASQSDETIAKKILISFDISQYNKDEDGNYPDELSTYINIDTNGDQSASVSELEEGYRKANYYTNLVNADELDYEVTYMYYNDIEASTESLLSFGQYHVYISFSRTMLATIVSLALVSLLLVAIYRLGALSNIATTCVTIFGALALSILFNVPFNLATLIGLMVVALASVASGVVYLQKIKEEIYRGRSMKKANSEAFKRCILPVVDINVVTVIVGVFVFILGGQVMFGLSSTLVLGGLISLLLNTLGMRGLMWMLTNNTNFTGKFRLLGVDESKVPNVVNEEKQTYFGAFADKKPTKAKKPVGIAALVLLVGSIAGMIVFGSINKGNIFNTATNTQENSEIYFEAVNKELAFSETIVKDILDDMLIYEEGKSEDQMASLLKHVDGDILIPSTMSEKKSENGVVNEYIHYYYVANLDKAFNSDLMIYEKDSGTVSPVADAFDNYLTNAGLAESCTISLKGVTNVTNDKPGFSKITLATFVGLSVSFVYLALRYRLSRGIASYLVTGSVGAITIGFFTLTRIITSTYILAMLPGVVIASMIMQIFFMNKERELVLEDKEDDRSVAHREEIMETANSQALSYLILFLTAALYVALFFYGFGPHASSMSFLFMIVGLLIAFALNAVLFGPFAQLNYRLTSKIKFEFKPRKNKKKVVKTHSGEPEEAIFIGIND